MIQIYLNQLEFSNIDRICLIKLDHMIFVDDGFFGLVKKHFQKEGGKPKKYLQTFRNICKKENFNLKNTLEKTQELYTKLF